MDSLDFTVCARDIERLAKQQALTAWKIGDLVNVLKELVGSHPGWIGRLKDQYTELDCMSPADLSLYSRAAATFTQEEREYDLPWCMYAYAVRHTDDPSIWVRLAVENNWGLSQMRREILAGKSSPSDTIPEEAADLLPNLIFNASIKDREGGFIGVISAYVDVSDLDAEPQVVFELSDQRYALQEALAIQQVLDSCIKAVIKYLGVAGVSISGVTELEAACVA